MNNAPLRIASPATALSIDYLRAQITCEPAKAARAILEWLRVMGASAKENPAYRAAAKSIISVVARIEVTSAVSTAAIHLRKRELYLNPEFFAEWVLTHDDLLFLLLHERWHLLLDTLTCTGRVSGFEEDVLINMLVMQQVPEATLTTRFYPTQVGSLGELVYGDWLLLQPNHNLVAEMLALPAFQVSGFDEVLRRHASAYSKGDYLGLTGVHNWVRLMNVVKLWRDSLPRSGKGSQRPGDVRKPGGLTLLGAHSGEERVGRPDHANIPPMEGSAASQGHGRWVDFSPMYLAAGLAGIPLSASESAFLDATSAHSANELVGSGPFNQLISRVGASLRATGKLGWDSRPPAALSFGDMSKLASGSMPVHWEHRASAVRARTSLYMDLSGSMTEHWGPVFAIWRQLRNNIDDFFVFASDCVPYREGMPGENIGFGTQLDPVLTSMADGRARSVIWVTDCCFSGATSNPLIYCPEFWQVIRRLDCLHIIIPNTPDLANAEQHFFMPNTNYMEGGRAYTDIPLLRSKVKLHTFETAE